MSLVTATERARALALLNTGSNQRNELLLSLISKPVWTTAQRALVEKIWHDEWEKRRQAKQARTGSAA